MKFEATRESQPVTNDLLGAAVESYRSSLLDMGRSGYQACPAFGANLRESLEVLAARLASDVSADALQETRRDASEQLSLWGERTAEHFKGKAEEVKDLLDDAGADG